MPSSNFTELRGDKLQAGSELQVVFFTSNFLAAYAYYVRARDQFGYINQ